MQEKDIDMNPECPHCGSSKIRYTDVDQIACGMPDCGKTTDLTDFIKESETEVTVCPYCQTKKLHKDPYSDRVFCANGHKLPPRPGKQTIEALKAMSGRGRPKSQLERKVKIEIEERPNAPDFSWFVSDIARVARSHGYKMIDASNYPNDRKAWVHSIGRYNLDLGQLKADYEVYLTGEKGIDDVSSAKHCRDNLLLESTGILNMKPENAQALSAALKEVLPLERGRAIDGNIPEMREIDIILRKQEWVSQKIAVKRTGYSDSWIRKLSRKGTLERKKNTGHIKSESLIALLISKGRSIYA